MSCPSGDCQDARPCGCSGTTPAQPILPRCQNVSLAPGVYRNATVTVGPDGCITVVAEGAAPVYQPDDCCGGGTSGGSGSAGPRGPKGDPGAAATIEVNPVVLTGSPASVTNTGTSSAAVLQFTLPASTGGGGSSGGGTTASVCGMEVANGLVQTMPTTLLTGVLASAVGAQSGLVTITAAPASPSAMCTPTISINVDALYNELASLVTQLRQDHDTAIATLRDDMAAADTLHNQQILALQALTTTHTTQIAAITAQLATCCPPVTPGGGG